MLAVEALAFALVHVARLARNHVDRLGGVQLREGVAQDVNTLVPGQPLNRPHNGLLPLGHR
eukprot:scaffold16329_cov121-Isochrysis_galbana.AAC.4